MLAPREGGGKTVVVAALVLAILVVLAGSGGATASGETSGSGSLSECRSAALLPPTIKHPLRERHAGLWPGMGFPGAQVISGGLYYSAMPESCAPTYVRTARGRLQMERDGKWVAPCGNCVGWYSNRMGLNRIFFAPPHSDIPGDAIAYNVCGADGKFGRLRIWVITQLKLFSDHSLVAHSRKFIYPIAVSGSCRQAAVSTKRVEALWEREYGIPAA
jgi:hypothetical protein